MALLLLLLLKRHIRGWMLVEIVFRCWVWMIMSINCQGLLDSLWRISRNNLKTGTSWGKRVSIRCQQAVKTLKRKINPNPYLNRIRNVSVVALKLHLTSLQDNNQIMQLPQILTQDSHLRTKRNQNLEAIDHCYHCTKRIMLH